MADVDDLLAQFRFVAPSATVSRTEDREDATGIPTPKRPKHDPEEIERRVERWASAMDNPDMCVLVFDTETTTLRGSVIQFACILADQTGEQLLRYNELWKTNEPIHPEAAAKHHITTLDLAERGLERSTEVAFAIALLTRVSSAGATIAAHNSSYDIGALKKTAECHEVIATTLDDIPVVCTMRGSRLYCGLTAKNGRSKNASNTELYQFLFGSEPEGQLHDALVDTRVTLASFVEGRTRGWW